MSVSTLSSRMLWALTGSMVLACVPPPAPGTPGGTGGGGVSTGGASGSGGGSGPGGSGGTVGGTGGTGGSPGGTGGTAGSTGTGGAGGGGGASGTGGSGGSSGTGGTTGTGGASGRGGAAGAGGAVGTGGSTGAGGRADAGGPGGAPGVDAGGGPDAPSGGAPDVAAGSGNYKVTLQFDSEGCHDLEIAVGPTTVVYATNPGFANVYSKTGAKLVTAKPFDPNPGAHVGDPHVTYDASSQRFFISSVQPNGASGADVYVSVSLDDTGRNWKPPIKVMGVDRNGIDNPQLVVTTDKVSMLVIDCIFTMDKSAVMEGGNNAYIPAVKTCGIMHTDQTYGADYGPNPPATAYFAVMSDNSHFNWVSIEGTPKAGNVKMTQHPLALSKPFVRIPAFPGVTPYGGIPTRNSGNMAEWDNNQLWWSQSGKCGAGGPDVCPRMFNVNTATGVFRDFDMAMPGQILWSCAPGVDKNGNMYALMAQSNATTPISMAIGGMTNTGVLVPPKTVFPGVGMFPDPQFGDYWDAAQDPVDGTIWAVGQYAKNGQCIPRIVHIVPE